jgi:hypothetical protein
MDLMQLPIGTMDRRANSRFPMNQDVTYKVQGKLAVVGAGKSVNMGSGGVLFTTSSRLPVGRTVEVAMNWPALLDGSCPLKFVATGPVVRADDTQAVIRIDRYEFRTRGARANLADSIGKLNSTAVLRPSPIVR